MQRLESHRFSGRVASHSNREGGRAEVGVRDTPNWELLRNRLDLHRSALEVGREESFGPHI